MKSKAEWKREQAAQHMSRHGGNVNANILAEYKSMLDAKLEADWAALQCGEKLRELRGEKGIYYSYTRRTGPVVYEVCQDCGNRRHACVCAAQAEAESEWDRR